MKHFKLMKGMLACLLSLALVVSVINPVGAKADPATTYTVSLAANTLEGVSLTKADGTGLDASYNANDEVEFKVVLSDAVSAEKEIDTVKNGDTVLTATEGVYKVTVDDADIVITVTLKDKATEPTEEANVITATYKPETDKVEFSGTKAGKVYYAIVKKAGSKIGKKFSEITLGDGNKAEIVLDSSEGGVKVDPTKDLYLWYGVAEPDAKTTYKPLLTVDATSYKKFAVTFNYATADNADAIAVTKISAKVGKTEKEIAKDDVQWRYAKDGETFGEWNLSAETLKGKDLADAIKDAADGKPTFEFKVKATPATEAQEATPAQGTEGEDGYEPAKEAVPAKNAVRGSKSIKVVIKKAANAPKVKADYVKGTIAVKNGMDYAVMTEDKEPTAADWITVLPVKKGGADEDGFIATTSYVPAAKVTTDTKTMFTTKKIKSLSIADLFEAKENPDNIYVYVRKSATSKAGASAYAKVTIAKPAAAPTFAETVIEGTKGKKGYSYTLIPKTEALVDGTYEYLIIKSTDNLATLDLSSAKWTKLTDKGIVVEKAKSKISKQVSNVLKADGTFDILIRKAAVKGDSPVLASNYVRTNVAKAVVEGSGDTETSKITWTVKTETPEDPVQEDEKVVVNIADAPENTTVTVSIKDSEDTIVDGAEVTKDTVLVVTITPAEGYTLSAVKVNDVDATAVEDSTNYTAEVTASEAITITVTATVTAPAPQADPEP